MPYFQDCWAETTTHCDIVCMLHLRSPERFQEDRQGNENVVLFSVPRARLVFPNDLHRCDALQFHFHSFQHKSSTLRYTHARGRGKTNNIHAIAVDSWELDISLL